MYGCRSLNEVLFDRNEEFGLVNQLGVLRGIPDVQEERSLVFACLED